MTLSQMFFGKPKPSPKFIPEVQRQRVVWSAPMKGICFALMHVRFVTHRGEPICKAHAVFFEN